MFLLKILLLATIIFVVITYFVYTFIAYKKVPNIDKWSQQVRILVLPWWVFDKTLLASKDDHLRKKARTCFFVYLLALLLLFYVRS